jgi:hypothetical protein
MATERQFEANRKNSKRSCGPKSPGGKDRSKMNPLKLGLFTKSALLPGEDPKDLARLNRELAAQYQPQRAGEKQLVDEIAAVKWRLLRCSKVESGLFHLYRLNDGKAGNEAQAFANDLKNLSGILKLPMVEGHLERKLDRLLKRLALLRSGRA